MVLKSEEMGQYNKSHQFRSMILAARDLKVFFKSNDDFDLEKLLKLKSWGILQSVEVILKGRNCRHWAY